jgi:hypothetical protein
MIARISGRTVFLVSIIATAVSSFALGVMNARDEAAMRTSHEDLLETIRVQVRSELGRTARSEPMPKATTGHLNEESLARAQMVAEIKQELTHELGLVPVQLMRERRTSFVELYAYDSFGKTNYGTAGYLGEGYFITVKHAVVALPENQEGGRRIKSIHVMHRGEKIPATLVDAGDADSEVHSGDWAIIRTQPLDLPALVPDTEYAYDFADPIVRFGNDYSKGIMLSTGYIGQRTSNGLVTCLTDGHPGVSGGGVVDREGYLVGIPVGRMQGDYRFSFILPIRAEMLRKVPRMHGLDLDATVASK